VTKVGLKAKSYNQSRTSMTIQDGASSTIVLNNIMTVLRHQQIAIDDRISRWLRRGSLAECTDSLRQFGLFTLRPFIELCLRYTFQPMSTEHIKDLRITVSRTLDDNVDYCIGSDALNALPRRTNTRTNRSSVNPPDLLIVRGVNIAYVRIVYPNNQKSASDGKLVVSDLDSALSAYIYFYHKYCKALDATPVVNTKTDRTRKRYQSGSTNLLFTGPFGGQWKEIIRDVCTYATSINLPVQRMGLTGRNYHHVSRIQWIATRAVQTSLDMASLTADAVATGSEFKNENKYYPVLSTMRRMIQARDLFETRTSDPLPISMQLPYGDKGLYLNRTTKGLDSLYAEMKSTESEGPYDFVTEDVSRVRSRTVDRIKDRERWETSVMDHRDLYSETVRSKRSRDRAYLKNDRRNQQTHWANEQKQHERIMKDVSTNDPTNGALLYSCVGR
jgi:hypothetical protein